MALTEMQQKWVDALRSGKYRQAVGYLSTMAYGKVLHVLTTMAGGAR